MTVACSATPTAARAGTTDQSEQLSVGELQRLARLATHAGRELETASAAEILTWAAETFGDGFCVASSMRDAVLSHLASTVCPGIHVVFLDTGYHFPETVGTANAVSATLPVEVIHARPRQTVAEQNATLGNELFARNPDLCCQLRKVAPMERILAGYRAWATGARRDESTTRAHTPVVSWDARRQRVKLAPLARWTDADVDRYIAEHDILVNPLVQDGYPSIGCEPCTHRVAPGDDPRSGRWAGTTKTECGLNT